ncbi:MAG: Holliday junction resolvase RuvX [bacterium]
MPRLLGIDYGTKRVGIAVSDEAGQIAFPKEVLKNDNLLLSKIGDICKNDKITTVIIGESKNFNGEDNPIMEEIYDFMRYLEEVLKLEVILEPEFLSSHQAARVQGEHGKLDASAAAIILQSYLDKGKCKTKNEK